MFTGIVTDIGDVVAIDERAQGLRRLTIACAYDPASIAIGASICCSGVCMTAVATGKNTFSVDAAAETLKVTTVGRWRTGTRINLERSLKMGDELGGHLVSGHVDGLADLVQREDLTDMARLTLCVPEATRALHCAERLCRARWRVVDGQRRRGRSVLRAHHSSHARRHDTGRPESR